MFSQMFNKNLVHNSTLNFPVAFILMILTLTAFSIEIYSNEDIVLYQLSPRIGNEIDRQERDYFYLFPDFEDFELAKAYKLSHYSIRIDIYFIKKSIKSDTFLIISIPESQALENYISNFEFLSDKKNRIQFQKIKYPITNFYAALQKFHLLKKQHNKREFETLFIVDSQRIINWGQLLYATDTSVVLWNDTSFYDWHKIANYLKVFHYCEIKKIVIEREGSFLSGAGSGFMIGGGIGALAGLVSGSDSEGIIQFSAGTKALFGGLFLGTTGGLVGGILGAAKGTDDEIIINGDKRLFKQFSLSVKKNAVFAEHVPPEIIRYLIDTTQHKKQVSDITKITKQTEAENNINSYIEIEKSETVDEENKIHISFMSNYTNTKANNDITDALKKSGFGGSRGNWLFGGTTNYPIDESYILSWHLETSYSYFTNYRFGVGLKKIAPQEVRGIGGVSENLEGYTGNLLVDWIIDPYDINTLDRWEHMLGIGITYNKIKINRNYDYIVKGKTEEKNLFGFQLRSGLDYYPSPSLSFQVKFSIDIVPSISLDDYRFDDGNELLQKHRINLSGFDISVGFRIHI